jgi:superfamily I DNA/RNA helicase
MAELNAVQKAAVDHHQGPLLILAGAGSGKTRVITHRIAALVRRGVAPEQILAVSFTNKAAEEMGERMVPLIGSAGAGKLWLSTFHSFGLRFVKEERKALRLASRFVVFDQADCLGVVKDILRELRRAGAARKLDPAAILARVSAWKSALISPATVPESDFEYDDVARELYPEYEARLRAMCAVDFDDLVGLPVQLLGQSAEVRANWRARFEHVLVDEFQDTSKVQLELIKLLANERGNVCVVGDDDQSIYGWRGADVSNILDFDRHFPGARILKLEENYRSRPAVLAVANAAISQSSGRRHVKALRAMRPQGDKVRVSVCQDSAEEARLVAREIADLCKGGVRRGSVAVLYRSNLQARAIEEELRAEGVAYRVFGGMQFFDRREVKDIAAYLRVLLNPSDEVSLRRIINQPPRGIGAKTVAQIQSHAERHAIPFAQALARIDTVPEIGDGPRRAVQSFSQMMASFQTRLDDPAGFAALARELVDKTGIRRHLQDASEGGDAAAYRWANVEHWLGWLEKRARDSGGDKRALRTFLERVTLGAGKDAEEAGDAVTLSTLHGTKGLEFDVVFLIGCVEGQLPHSRTTDPKVTEVNATDVDEERRLFYVGVTRARERLYLSRYRRKSLRGQNVELTASRFLDGLPEDQIEVYERPEQKQLNTDEIAELGREFLRNRKPLERAPRGLGSGAAPRTARRDG